VYGPGKSAWRAGVNAIFIGMMLEGTAANLRHGRPGAGLSQRRGRVQANELALEKGSGEIVNIGRESAPRERHLPHLKELLDFDGEPIYESRGPVIQRIYLDARARRVLAGRRRCFPRRTPAHGEWTRATWRDPSGDRHS